MDAIYIIMLISKNLNTNLIISNFTQILIFFHLYGQHFYSLDYGNPFYNNTWYINRKLIHGREHKLYHPQWTWTRTRTWTRTNYYHDSCTALRAGELKMGNSNGTFWLLRKWCYHTWLVALTTNIL